MKGSTLTISRATDMTRDNVLFNGMGVTGSVPVGSSGNVDLLLQDDCFLTGGQLNVKGGTFGDGADMQVIDLDGVYAPKGTVLAQFATNIQIIDSQQKQMEFDLDYVAKILGGLYLRVVYRSTGTLAGSVLIAANYLLHKARY